MHGKRIRPTVTKFISRASNLDCLKRSLRCPRIQSGAVYEISVTSRNNFLPNTTNDSPALLTTDEAQAWFRGKGLTVSEWAMERGFNPTLVYSILSGKRKCLRGQSFRIAVALRLKQELQDDQGEGGDLR